MRRVRVVGRFGVGALTAAIVACAMGCPPTLPEARFGVAPASSGEAPFTVRFYDHSWPHGSAITTWAWSFGDGGTSDLQDPRHTYAVPGDYEVRLTVSNASGSNTLVRSGYIRVSEMVLSNKDRVGIVFGTAGIPVGDEAEPGFYSVAFFAPGELEQLTSLGYVASSAGGDGMGGINFVECLAADSTRVLNEVEFQEWMAGDFDEFADSLLAAPLSISGLDAGDVGSVSAASQTRELIRWEESDHFPFTAGVPPLASGLYLQDGAILSTTAPLTAALAWPGGVHLGAISAAMDLPASLTVLTPFDFGPGDPFWEAVAIDRILTSEALSLTWEPSGDDGAYLQLILLVRSDSDLTVLLCKAIDDGAFTIPAAVMGQLPAESWEVDYQQELIVSRIRGKDVNVPVTGTSNNGVLRLTATTAPYAGMYSNDKSARPLLEGPRPFLNLLKRLRE